MRLRIQAELVCLHGALKRKKKSLLSHPIILHKLLQCCAIPLKRFHIFPNFVHKLQCGLLVFYAINQNKLGDDWESDRKLYMFIPTLRVNTRLQVFPTIFTVIPEIKTISTLCCFPLHILSVGMSCSGWWAVLVFLASVPWCLGGQKVQLRSHLQIRQSFLRVLYT